MSSPIPGTFLIATCSLLMLFRAPLSAINPHPPLAQLYHSSWNARNGLDGSVTALAQTTDGYLWVGTTDGLYRFDGLSFERYRPETGRLPSNSVSTLLSVPDGGLWVGYARGGASFLRQGRVTDYSERDGFPVSAVRSFAQDRTGTVWAAVVGGFARLEGRRWRTIRMDWNFPNKSAWKLLVDREGTLWVAAGNQLLILPEGEKRFQDTGIRTGEVFAFVEAANGAILFHDNDRDVLRVIRRGRDGTIEQLPDIDIAARTALLDRDGGLWIGGYGLSRVPFPEQVRNHQFEAASETFTRAQGMTDDVAQAILEDREGNIWVGTEGGLDRFRYRNLSWSASPGGTFSLVAGDGGDVWAGSRRGYRFFRVQTGKPALNGPFDVLLTYRDPDGSIWISAHDSLVHWEHGTFTRAPPPEQAEKVSRSATPRDPIVVSSITSDRLGRLWVSFGGSGEFVFKDGAWTFVDVLPEHPDWAANYAFTDAADRVWLAYGNVVAAIDHGRVRTFGSADGLTTGPFNVITERGQQVWVGGESGLSYLRGDRFQTLSQADGSRFGSITGMVAPPHDGLWLSADLGIVHIPELELEAALQHPEHTTNFDVFDLASDLPEQLQRGGIYSSGAIRSDDGVLWFATRTGVARIDPRHIFRNPVPPPLAIRSVVADDKTYSSFTEPALPALTRNLRIDYAALSLSIPERVRFRYKMEGWDDEWHDAGARRQAFYTDLGPGKYTFRVIACNNDGVWNEQGTTLTFSIAPAWYQTGWFRGLCVVAAILVVWTLYRLRLRQVANALSARFDERLAERTRMARELHDTFLQTIQGSKLVADDALERPGDTVRTRQALEQLSEWLARAIQEGRAALNSLRTSTTQRNDLADALHRATENDVVPQSMAVSFSVVGHARDLHPVVRDEVYRIGYEAIRNACLHSSATRLEIELRYAQALTVHVRDNGVGIDPTVREKGKDGHFGLQGMRERAARIGGKLAMITSPSGTEITLIVPGGIIFQTSHPFRQGTAAKIRTLLRLKGPDSRLD
jgi:signal transduction histidine kinase/ligand-binding sensor domain-containing protein